MILYIFQIIMQNVLEILKWSKNNFYCSANITKKKLRLNWTIIKSWGTQLKTYVITISVVDFISRRLGALLWCERSFASRSRWQWEARRRKRRRVTEIRRAVVPRRPMTADSSRKASVFSPTMVLAFTEPRQKTNLSLSCSVGCSHKFDYWRWSCSCWFCISRGIWLYCDYGIYWVWFIGIGIWDFSARFGFRVFLVDFVTKLRRSQNWFNWAWIWMFRLCLPYWFHGSWLIHEIWEIGQADLLGLLSFQSYICIVFMCGQTWYIIVHILFTGAKSRASQKGVEVLCSLSCEAFFLWAIL